jgi:serine protease Do
MQFGNPIGFEFRRTVTSGIISAKNRTIKIEEENKSSYMTNLIQTDATINPGNSGGPLIYPNGEIIGVNTVKISTAEGIGFAVPINIIKPVVESFKQKGTFEEASLGIYAYDNDIAEYLNLKSKTNKGVYISEITVNGPAYGSELKEGDLIVSIDGNTTETINAIRKYIYTKLPGDTVVLKIIKGDREKEVNIVLGKK